MALPTRSTIKEVAFTIQNSRFHRAPFFLDIPNEESLQILEDFCQSCLQIQEI
jgi:hypothetical protein